MNIYNTLLKEFEGQFGEFPHIIVRAPGRVNLIGEHTDYNNGFVLPMAIDRYIWIAIRPRDDRRLLLRSLEFESIVDVSLDNVEHTSGWQEYVHGILWVLNKNNINIKGWEGILTSNVPVGAGLSSSAALEISLLKAFYAVTGSDWDGTLMAKFAQQADNEWVGIKSGIMDQMISANGKKSHAMLLDCRSLSTTFVPLPKNTNVIILDTNTRRGLVDSKYNDRVNECKIAASYFGHKSLRDVSLEAFKAANGKLDEIPSKRAKHVLNENHRTINASKAMINDDPLTLGDLMNSSHDSLDKNYEVSSNKLNIMVKIARSQKGCYGARMTGAGFGGCAVSLVEEKLSNQFQNNVYEEYFTITGIKPNIYVCKAGSGAAVIH
ncbi:MAG: galactokinase [Candidatus Marinimicrobia bacterium]|nr:galactokinase [Candidatus Neomarinimicrobiota bacterium]